MIKTITWVLHENKIYIQNIYMVCMLTSAAFFFMTAQYLEGFISLLFFGSIFCPVFGFTYQNLIKRRKEAEI